MGGGSRVDPAPTLSRIFEEKLRAWHRLPADWPQKRTYKMFRQWFHVRLVDLVLDLEEGPTCRTSFDPGNSAQTEDLIFSISSNTKDS